MNQNSTLRFLKVAAAALGLLCLGQLLLGILTLTDESGFKEIHGILGMTTAGVSVVAGIAAVLWKRVSGNAGLMGHALGTAVLALIQVALGELELETLHITLGLITVVSGIALATLVFRKPGAPIA